MNKNKYYNEGWQAYEEGNAINPYNESSESEKYNKWELGWNDAHDFWRK